MLLYDAVVNVVVERFKVTNRAAMPARFVTNEKVTNRAATVPFKF